MNDTRIRRLTTAVANGVLVGASLDQSIKQLPARRVIGPAAYARYAAAADGGNGIAWYAALGVGTAGLTLTTAVAALRGAGPRWPRAAAAAAGALSVAHSVATTRAAPIMLSLRGTEADDQEIARRLDRFERWQTVRVALQVATLAAALAAAAGPGDGRPSAPRPTGTRTGAPAPSSLGVGVREPA